MIVRSILAVLLLLLMMLGIVICLFGLEAVTTGANPGSWWSSLVLMVILPGVYLVYLTRPTRRPPGA